MKLVKYFYGRKKCFPTKRRTLITLLLTCISLDFLVYTYIKSKPQQFYSIVKQKLRHVLVIKNILSLKCYSIHKTVKHFNLLFVGFISKNLNIILNLRTIFMIASDGKKRYLGTFLWSIFCEFISVLKSFWFRKL